MKRVVDVNLRGVRIRRGRKLSEGQKRLQAKQLAQSFPVKKAHFAAKGENAQLEQVLGDIREEREKM